MIAMRVAEVVGEAGPAGLAPADEPSAVLIEVVLVDPPDLISPRLD